MRMVRSRRSELLVTSTICRVAAIHLVVRNPFVRFRSVGIQPLPGGIRKMARVHGIRLSTPSTGIGVIVFVGCNPTNK